MIILLLFASMSALSGKIFNTKSQMWTFYNTYSLLDSLVWGYIFYRNSRNKKIKIIITTIIFSEVIFAFYLFSSIGIYTRFFTELVCLNSLLELLWVLSFFYERYKRDEVAALEKEPMFWYCLGILVYAPTTYFLFVFFEVVRFSNDVNYKNLWSIHYLLNTSMYLIFSIGILTNVLKPSKLINVFSRYKS